MKRIKLEHLEDQPRVAESKAREPLQPILNTASLSSSSSSASSLKVHHLLPSKEVSVKEEQKENIPRYGSERISPYYDSLVSLKYEDHYDPATDGKPKVLPLPEGEWGSRIKVKASADEYKRRMRVWLAYCRRKKKQ